MEQGRKSGRPEIPPGSILHLAEQVNKFLGVLPDETPITAIARVDLNSDRRNAQVELVGDFWQEIGATPQQSISLRSLFRNLLFNARDIDTLGKVRRASEDKHRKRINRIQGMGDTAELFLAIAVKRTS